MSDLAYPAVPTHIPVFSEFAAGVAYRKYSGAAFATGTWTTANTAVYIPLQLPFPYLVNRMFWNNGSAAAGNLDIGIYSQGGGAIWTAGSTAASGNSAAQYVSTPGILLNPGNYFLGFASDSTTTNQLYVVTPTATGGRFMGIYQQATALPLPTGGTLASFSAFTGMTVPLIGITNTTTGF